MSAAGQVSLAAPGRLRSFDPMRLAGLEYQAWVGYYRRRWPRVLIAAVGLVRAGFGLSWGRTLYGAWLVLRANQLWAPDPGQRPRPGPGLHAAVLRPDPARLRRAVHYRGAPRRRGWRGGGGAGLV